MHIRDSDIEGIFVAGEIGQLKTEHARGGKSASAPRVKKASPYISVIIPAHNEAGYLGTTLLALEEQTFRNREVIVVANGCNDATVEAAREHCDRLIVLSQKGLGVARNLGARISRGELLVFLDADTVLDLQALERVAQEFKAQHAAGTLKGQPDRPGIAYRLFYAAKNVLHRSRLHPGSSGVILCWREHFLKLGGFDEGLEVRENSELMRRLRQFGSYKYINNSCATTSMRRFEQKGLGRVFWLWLRVWWQTHFGDLHHRRYEAIR